MLPFEGKTIIFGVSKVFGLNEFFESELKALGFNTIDISFHTHNFKYRNLFQRIEKLIAKHFFAQKNYKEVLDFRRNKRDLEEKLAQVEHADYILITRPDMYPIDFIKKLREKGGKMVAYQWDGLERFPRIVNYIHLFDRFFVFDGKDLNTPSVMPMTNFYPDSFGHKQLFDQAFRSQIVYSGSYSRTRVKLLYPMVELFKGLNYDFRYIFYSQKRKSSKPYNLEITNKAVEYTENLKYAYNSDVIIDFVCADHAGLSFRIFEALGFGKKLITNNEMIKYYDFYNPNNMMIWNNQDMAALKSFIEKPFTPYPEKIRLKYGFSNWIRYALDVDEYIPLSLPT